MKIDSRYIKAEKSTVSPDVIQYDTDQDGRPIIHADGYVWRLIEWPVKQAKNWALGYYPNFKKEK